MTSSENDGGREARSAPCAPEDPPGEAELLAAGWQRCFVADEPRLSEALDIYSELGYDVTLPPFTPEESVCSECISQDPDRCRVIYIRKQDPI